MGQILVGTCSWTDPTLLATDFYPIEANTPEKRLKYYSSLFPSVEVDSTYYSVPSPKTAKLWVERTPSDFKFSVKSFSLFTLHPTKLQSIPDDLRAIMPSHRARALYYHDIPESVADIIWQKFSDALLPLDSAGKLGIVLFQFPKWFLPGNASLEHLLKCKAKLPQYRLAIEFRNCDWLAAGQRQRTIDFLKHNNFIYVCVDEPQGFRSSVPPVIEVTSDIAVVRFHGRNKENWERNGISVAERFKYLYSKDELGEWVTKLAGIAPLVKQLYVLFNNCYCDYGIRNAQDIARLMASQPYLFPDYIWHVDKSADNIAKCAPHQGHFENCNEGT